MSYIFRYSGLEVIEVSGEKPVLRFLSEANREYFEKILGGDYPFWLIIDEYRAKLYSSESLPPTSKTLLIDIGRFKGYIKAVGSHSSEPSIKVSFDIPINEVLLDALDRIRLEGRIPIFEVICDYTTFKINAPDRLIRDCKILMKYLPDGRLDESIFLTTEELTNFMKKVKYMDVLRMEIPIPRLPSPESEILKKCSLELKSAHEKLIEGKHREALSICRNVLMNYLISRSLAERKLRPEIKDLIISRVPKEATEKYKLILDGIETTLRENLNHIHKFIKEDTGELLTMPLKEDAEYIFIMISSVVNYLSRLMQTSLI